MTRNSILLKFFAVPFKSAVSGNFKVEMLARGKVLIPCNNKLNNLHSRQHVHESPPLNPFVDMSHVLHTVSLVTKM
jgi:hypothetical protein